MGIFVQRRRWRPLLEIFLCKTSAFVVVICFFASPWVSSRLFYLDWKSYQGLKFLSIKSFLVLVHNWSEKCKQTSGGMGAQISSSGWCVVYFAETHSREISFPSLENPLCSADSHSFRRPRISSWLCYIVVSSSKLKSCFHPMKIRMLSVKIN